MGVSLLTAIVTGIYLATAYWGWRGAWMGMALLAILIMGLVGGFMTGRTTMRVMRSTGDALGAAEIAAVQRRLSLSSVIRLGIFLGIFLMTTKPTSGVVALLVIVIAAALGVLAGLPARRVRGTVRA